MPNKPKTQHRSVRIGDDEWRDLLAAAQTQGTDRAGAINDLVAWYLRRPGATMPKRPDIASWSSEEAVTPLGEPNYVPAIEALDELRAKLPERPVGSEEKTA